MEVRRALFLVIMVYITLSRVQWIIASDMGTYHTWSIASDMGTYHTWSTAGWLIAGVGALMILVMRSDTLR